ncbi:MULTISPECIES: UDP-glucose 4-epimerase GalE [unclassified Actinotalea]|uniref:UDP-glucose 4-epimerase GalE n=1 Tax=unclassified Actinotalea TaxID=2638618 RepID=UPI0015F5CF53|nr:MULTISPECIES: UDP-glucose 4-epimerase GalE [unclassified Actinotalea]
MTVLVTGGAGYIGAHVVRLLVASGLPVVVVDDLSTGDADRLPGVALEVMDLAASSAVERLSRLMAERGVTDVVHLAARKRVEESVRRPAWYYQQNVTGLAQVVSAMEDAGVGRLVFSSSAAVYGETGLVDVDEDATTRPVNPYGETKLAGEWLVRAAADAGVLRAISLRYFNVAGAGWPDLGDHEDANLVGIVLARLERGEAPVIFGDDFATEDGTGVRDFVHVLDLARAHLAALDHLAGSPDRHEVLNVGTGRGTSVREVVSGLCALTGSDVEPVRAGRRPGDPARVVAATGRIERVLGWRPEATLHDMLASAVAARRR